MEVNSLHPGDPINEQHSDVFTGLSIFDNGELNYSLAGTYRFGEISPFFVFDGLTGDRCSVRSSHDVRSLNMKSPLMGNISLKKDYFNVPMEAILPLNWDKIFTNPLIGDDVPIDANCVISSVDFFDAWQSIINDLLATTYVSYTDNALTSLFQDFCRIDLVFGDGALPAALGIHFNECVRIANSTSRESWSWFFDNFFGLFAGVAFTIKTVDSSGTVLDSYGINGPGQPGLHRAIEIMKDNLNFKLDFALTSQQRTDLSVRLNEILDANYTLEMVGFSEPYINMARFYAYQICVAHFYSNDKIDYVYSANLYRQYIRQLTDQYGNSGSFILNGLYYQYDALSGNCVNADILSDTDFYAFACQSAVFGYRNSLRYVDYFTGARSQPLAVGDTGVSVSGNQIDVVDVTRKIQVQRYLNAVNRAGRKFSDYIKGIFGVTPAYDYHDPKYLAHTTDSIFATETQNTGADQLLASNSTTSNLRTNASRYAFQYELDRPGVVIGLQYFDLPRYYTASVDRSFFHKDRFDMFNPQMQFIGDQKVFLNEVSVQTPGVAGEAFGYQSRYMEYKQRFNNAFGGFIHQLPTWAFLDNPAKYGTYSKHISPRFIRSTCEEMDQFFTSLTGYSNGSYFHFIIITDNDLNGTKRALVRDPKLL